MQKYQTETDRIEAKTAEIDYPKKCYSIDGEDLKYIHTIDEAGNE